MRRGDVFGFLGPNGAGKTTTVRTLGTLIAPTSGSATVAGIPLSPETGVEIRQRIAIMPEAPGLYLRLTVTENLEYFAGLYGLHRPAPRIEKALEAVNLADRAGDLCGRIRGVESWRAEGPGSYVLSVSEPRTAAPEVVRGLVNAGADVLTIGEVQHSLEDVYLELIAEDVEARKP